MLDYTDHVAAPDDGRRYEILRGERLVTPAPRPVHQRVLLRLATALREHLGRRSAGEVFVAPVDLILTEYDVLQPDLLVVDDARIITDRGIEGPPHLIVEILSKSTEDRDRGVKSRRYAERGVRHYWLVDPDARRVECRLLTDRRYETIVVAEGEETLQVRAFHGFVLRLSELWADSEAPSA